MRFFALLLALFPACAWAQPDCSVDAGAAAWSTGSSITVSPAGGAASSGELVILGLGWTAVSNGAWPTSYTAPMGFTLVDEHNLGGESGEYGELSVWQKIAGGSEPSSYEVSWSDGSIDSASLGVLVCSGADSMTPIGTPVDNGGGGASSETWDIPALDTTEDNSVDLVVVASNGDSTSGGALSAWGDSLIERVDFASGFSLIGMATAVRASAGTQGATTVTGPSNSNITLRMEVFAAGGSPAPDFDSGPTVTIIDHNTYRLTYDADAVADSIFVMLKNKDASTPSCADVEAGTGGVATASEATTGSSDTIDIDAPGSPNFPIFDVYWCLEEGTGNYSTLGSELDALLNAPATFQHLTISSVSMTGILEGSGAAAGDILQPSLVTTPGMYDLIFDTDGDFVVDAGGDESKQTFLAWFYDASMVAWSSMERQLICINNAAPRQALAYLGERSFLVDVAISPVELDSDSADDDGDARVVSTQSGALPTSLSLSMNDVTGTPSAENVYRTVHRHMDECEDFVDLATVWLIRPARPTFPGFASDLNLVVGNAMASVNFATAFDHDDAMVDPAMDLAYSLLQIGSAAVESTVDGDFTNKRVLAVADATGFSVGDYIVTESDTEPHLVLGIYGDDLELATGITGANGEDVSIVGVSAPSVGGLTLSMAGTLSGTPTTTGSHANLLVRGEDGEGDIFDSNFFDLDISVRVNPLTGRGGPAAQPVVVH